MEETEKGSTRKYVDHQVPQIIRSMWEYFSEVAFGVIVSWDQAFYYSTLVLPIEESIPRH